MSRSKETRENKSYLMKRKNISRTIRFFDHVWNTKIDTLVTLFFAFDLVGGYFCWKVASI